MSCLPTREEKKRRIDGLLAPWEDNGKFPLNVSLLSNNNSLHFLPFPKYSSLSKTVKKEEEEKLYFQL